MPGNRIGKLRCGGARTSEELTRSGQFIVRGIDQNDRSLPAASVGEVRHNERRRECRSRKVEYRKSCHQELPTFIGQSAQGDYGYRCIGTQRKRALKTATRIERR